MAWAVALGCGLLIGLERERRKGEGPDRAPAGIRSFTVASIAGALAESLGEPGIGAIGALLVAALALVGQYRRAGRDPSITMNSPGNTSRSMPRSACTAVAPPP